MWNRLMQCFADVQSPAFWGMALAVVFAGVAAGETNIDPVDKLGWGENIGFLNFRDGNGGQDGVEVSESYFTGYIWSENTGWINVGNGSPADGTHYANDNGLDFGVNIDTNGALFGLAWGENIGWINFDGGTLAVSAIPAVVDYCNRRLRGFVWGENVGWINLDDATHFVMLGPCGMGDYDCDGDVDLKDHAALVARLSGPGVTVDCPALDADDDGDVDLKDAAALQVAFTGD